MREQRTVEKLPELDDWRRDRTARQEFLLGVDARILASPKFDLLPDGDFFLDASNTFVAVWPRAVISLLKTWVSAHTVNDVLVSRECRFVWR